MYPERHTEKEKKKDHSYSFLFVWFVDDGDVDGMESFFRHKHHCRHHDDHHHWERRLQGRVWVTWDLNQPPESRAPSCQHSLHHPQWWRWGCIIIDIIVIIFFGTLFITLFGTLFITLFGTLLLHFLRTFLSHFFDTSAMVLFGLLQITKEWFQTLKWTGWDGPLVC